MRGRGARRRFGRSFLEPRQIQRCFKALHGHLPLTLSLSPRREERRGDKGTRVALGACAQFASGVTEAVSRISQHGAGGFPQRWLAVLLFTPMRARPASCRTSTYGAQTGRPRFGSGKEVSECR